ncbi:MAG: hypothetical protein RIR97_1895 [Pseudomonadota bacterium]|jgi:hypothetical protein
MTRQRNKIRLFQVDLARELDVSEMTITRAMKSIGRDGQRVTEMDAITVITMAELQDLKIAPHVTVEIINTFSRELLYVASNPRRTCWIVFAETVHASFQLASLNARHLASTLDALPMALTVPLHQVVARAKERLEELKIRKAAA